MTYNALDNQQSAARLYWKLRLEVDDIRDAISYDSATSFCTDCPGRDQGCCKDTGAWEQQYEGDFEHIKELTSLMDALKRYAGDEAVEGAKSE